MTTFLLIFGLTTFAWAQEPDDQPTSAPAGAQLQTFEQLLTSAKLKYFEGDVAGATTDFEMLRLRVAAGEAPPMTQLGEALIYLGEIYYQEGKSDVAEGIFRELLSLDPQYPISPYEHPMEVVGIFEMLRRSYLRPASQNPTPSMPPQATRLPLWGYAPFGVSHFRQKRSGAGALYASSQAILGLTSIVTFLHLRQINEVNPPPSWSEEELQRRVRNERLFVQWPATIGFYAVWTAAVIDGQRTWPRSQARSTDFTRTSGIQLTLSQAF